MFIDHIHKLVQEELSKKKKKLHIHKKTDNPCEKDFNISVFLFLWAVFHLNENIVFFGQISHTLKLSSRSAHLHSYFKIIFQLRKQVQCINSYSRQNTKKVFVDWVV